MAPPLAGEGAAAWYRIRVRPLDGVVAARRDAVDGQRHHPRARAPRELLPGSAARDRLSRPRAGRLLLRRAGRLDRPYERDARQLARLRHRAVRRRTAQARRHRRRRRRGAAQRRLRPSRRSDDRAVRRRPQAPRQGQFLPVRLLHRVAFSSAGLPGPSRTLVLNRAPGEDDGEDLRAAEVRFAALLQFDADGDRFGRRRRRRAARQRRLRRARAGGAEAAAPAKRGPRSIAASPSATTPRCARRSPAASEGKGDIAPVDLALAGDGAPLGALLRLAPPIRRATKARARSSSRSTPPSSARCRRTSSRARRCRRSASSPAASRTTSTTC